VTHGALALANGVLWVGRHAGTAHVRPYDLDGRALADGFSFRGPHGDACELGGFDVGPDHEIWVADRATPALRAFSVMGREIAVIAGAASDREDARGVIRRPVDVALGGSEEDPLWFVACAGWRRHAVQVFLRDGTCVESLRPLGDPRARFHGAARVAVSGRFAYVCEPRAGRVQVFRDREFHFAFRVPANDALAHEPVAVAALGDGRLVVACGGERAALLLVDGSGRLLRVLAQAGAGDSAIADPGDVAVDPAGSDRAARIALVDRDAERVRVFTLEGRCHGALESLPGQAL
jgi:hypothetical protein